VRQKAPFQPGATAARGDPKRRYLAFNEHGALKLHIASASPGSIGGGRVERRSGRAGTGSTALSGRAPAGRIEVEYTRERSAYSGREHRAPDGLEMGAIGPGLFALAAGAAGGQPARIIVHAPTQWEKQLHEHPLPEGERVEALAIGRHFVAALTSPNRLLRINTITGIAIAVLAISGPPVCLAAFEDLLLCVTEAPGRTWSASHGLGATPHLEYALYGIANRERLVSGVLPLSSAASLRWVAFSAEGMPLALDTAGVLRALALCGGAGTPLLAPASGEWLPVAELEGEGARLWPVTAEAGRLRCYEVPRDGDEPRVGPTPRLREINFRLPFGSEVDGPERVLRAGLFSAHMEFARGAGMLPGSRQRSSREAPARRRTERGGDGRQALGLFNQLTKSGDVELALDVAAAYLGGGGTEARLLDDARGIASKAGREGLAERLAALISGGEQPTGLVEEEDAEDDDEEESEGEEEEAQKDETPHVTSVAADARCGGMAAAVEEPPSVAAPVQAPVVAGAGGAPAPTSLTPEQVQLIQQRRQEALRRLEARKAAEAAALRRPREGEEETVAGAPPTSRARIC